MPDWLTDPTHYNTIQGFMSRLTDPLSRVGAIVLNHLLGTQARWDLRSASQELTQGGIWIARLEGYVRGGFDDRDLDALRGLVPKVGGPILDLTLKMDLGHQMFQGAVIKGIPEHGFKISLAYCPELHEIMAMVIDAKDLQRAVQT